MLPEFQAIIGLTVFTAGLWIYVLFFFGENDIRRKRAGKPKP